MDENKKETPKTRKRTRKSSAASVSAQSGETKTGNEKEESSESEKGPVNLKESVLYLKTVGLKKVSNKTFINESDLAAFLEQDFDKINKTRALGFIQILEREYPVKLDELRKAYLAHYHQNQKNEKQDLFVHAKAEHEYEWQKYLLWIVPLFLFIVALWYFNGSDKSELSTLESEEAVVSTDINSDIVTKAEHNLIKFEENNSAGNEIINSPRVSPFRREGEANKTPLVAVKDTDSNLSEESKNDDIDLDAMVKQMVQEYNLSTDQETEKSSTDITADIEKNVSAPVAVIAAPSKKEKKQVKKSKVIKAEKKSRTAEKKNVTVNSKLYIKPHKKSWVGIIYLDDYTKKDFLIRKILKLDASRPQLIVIGQKEFEIFNNGYSYRFRGRGPVRFIYKNGDIMEITNSEFRKYSKGTAW